MQSKRYSDLLNLLIKLLLTSYKIIELFIFLDINDCGSNPCEHNGTCTDLVADFACSCKDGWKGKKCSLKHGHCDYSTCQNGGTCQDLGHTFVCTCPPLWQGSVCHLGKVPAIIFF